MFTDSTNLPGSRIYPRQSVQGNYFVALDGEGIGNDYVLLDSSQADFPALVAERNQRLHSTQILDWLWKLGRRHGYADFVIFGAGYDFDNFVRDASRAGLDRYANGEPFQLGRYRIQRQKGFRFAIRRQSSDEPDKHDRIRCTRPDGVRVDYSSLVIWDAYPFWQHNFEDALDLTLGDRAIDRDLISWGKKARDHFSWHDILMMRAYNKAELVNLEWMMRELDSWLKAAGYSIYNWNGPGAAAKAALRHHKPYLHSGRRARVGKGGTPRVHEYVFPGVDHDEIWRATLGSYAGGRNELLRIGKHPARAWQYDIVSAYPSASVDLPCLTHGRWRKVRDWMPDKFGIWSVRYNATRALPLYPLFFRDNDGSIHYPSRLQNRWAHTSEVASALSIDAAGVQINGGFVWEPAGCSNPYPFRWIAEEFALRAADKRAGRFGASQARKLVLNSEYGNLAQARGGTTEHPPWTQQLLWAGAITAATRAKLCNAAMLAPGSICHLATDGIITLEELPLQLGKELGQWEVSELTDLMLVQYGIYFSAQKSRSRGIPLRYIHRTDIEEGWRKRIRTIPIKQKMFVTAGLVANNQRPYSEWCHWVEHTEELAICDSSAYRWGYPDTLDRTYPVTEITWEQNIVLGQSRPYEPKWGVTSSMPEEWIEEDLLEEAFAVGTHA